MRASLLWCLCLLSGLALEGRAEPVPLPDFEARYRLSYENFRVGEARYRLAHTADTFLYESHSQPVGLASWFRKDRVTERSTWVWHEQWIRPLSYQYQRRGGRKERSAELHFDWQQRRVENRVDGQPWEMDIPPRTLDKLVVTLALMLDLEQGRKDMEYAIADGGSLKRYRFRVVGEETIQTPAGSYPALKLERVREDNKRYTALWCAPALHYLPVRIQQRESDDSLLTSELQFVTENLRGTPPLPGEGTASSDTPPSSPE
jgi:predicted acetyltransferase